MPNASALPIKGTACCNQPMLSGEHLGAAIRSAMKLKGVTQGQVAAEFGIKQPSVSEWLKTGRVAKEHIAHLVSYFSDVVGPEHWGLAVGISPSVERLALAYEAASPESRAAFDALAEAILSGTGNRTGTDG